MQRQTRQRAAIARVLREAGRPLSPQEVLDAAQRRVPRLGMATVYRTLNALVDDGEMHAIQLPGQPSRYERADLGHHHHFYCTACDRVFDIDGCALKPAFHLPAGFEVHDHEITLTGRCPQCGPRP